MKIVTYSTGLAVILAAAILVSPAIYAADSAEVTNLLTEANSHVKQLKLDAEEMVTFTRSQINWQTHAAQLEEIKRHANDRGAVVQKMNDARSTASPWQQDAIDRITPVAKELASSLDATIDHVAKNQNRVNLPTMQEYVKANYELAKEAAAVVSDYVQYGESKVKFQKLGKSLAVSD